VPWLAAFPWDGDEVDLADVTLEVAPSVTLSLVGSDSAPVTSGADARAASDAAADLADQLQASHDALRAVTAERDALATNAADAVARAWTLSPRQHRFDVSRLVGRFSVRAACDRARLLQLRSVWSGAALMWARRGAAVYEIRGGGVLRDADHSRETTGAIRAGESCPPIVATGARSLPAASPVRPHMAAVP
jgi:hypothetical protein